MNSATKKKKPKGKPASPKKKRNWSWYFLLFLNCIAIVPLLISYSAPYISPVSNSIIAFFGLSFPLFLIINLIFIVIWLLKKSWMFLLPLIIIAIGYQHIDSFFQIKFKDKINSGKEIKVLTYNVRLFDIYNWTGKGEDVARKEIFDFVKKQDASVICFQEFYDGDKSRTPILSGFVDSQKAKNYYFDRTENAKTKFGLITFSTYPIVNSQTIRFSNSSSNFAIYTDLLVDKDTIRVFNLHFESLHFNKHDYALVSGITPDEEEIKTGSRRILGKVSMAFQKRASQADELISIIDQSPYPVIVCGDFNDTPTSYVYHTMSNRLNDAFVESGNCFQFTYAGSIPLLRIDYILYDDHFSSDHSKVHKINFSDHFPISSSLFYHGSN